MKRPFLQVLGAVLALAVVLFGLFTGYWFILADKTERALYEWADAQAAQGTQVEYGPVSVDGYPGSIRLILGAPRLQGPNGGTLLPGIGQWIWAADPVEAKVLWWAPRQLKLRLDGNHKVQALAYGEVRDLDVQLEKAAVDVLVNSDGSLRNVLSIIRRAVVHSAKTNEEMRINRIKLDSKVYQAATNVATPDFDFDLSLEQVQLPTALWGPLGTTMKGFALRSTMIGRPPRALTGSELSAWRADEGQIKIDRLDIDWGDLLLRSSGRFLLDDSLQPTVQLNGELRGWDLIIRTLRAEGQLGQREAAFATTALDALSKDSEEDGQPMLALSIFVRNQGFFIGPVKLAQLPTFVWP